MSKKKKKNTLFTPTIFASMVAPVFHQQVNSDNSKTDKRMKW